MPTWCGRWLVRMLRSCLGTCCTGMPCASAAAVATCSACLSLRSVGVRPATTRANHTSCDAINVACKHDTCTLLDVQAVQWPPAAAKGSQHGTDAIHHVPLPRIPQDSHRAGRGGGLAALRASAANAGAVIAPALVGVPASGPVLAWASAVASLATASIVTASIVTALIVPPVVPATKPPAITPVITLVVSPSIASLSTAPPPTVPPRGTLFRLVGVVRVGRVKAPCCGRWGRCSSH